MIPKFDSIIEQRKLNRHERRMFDSSGGSKKLARDLVNSLYRSTFESDNGFTSLDAFIACFCTHADDRPHVQKNGLGQWRGYSGGDGFCIVFDTPALSHLLGREFDTSYWVHLQINPVRYAVHEASLDDLLPELIEAGASTLREFFSDVQIPEMGMPEFLAGATLFTHQGFLEEREVRIVAIPGTKALHAQGKREHPDSQDLPLVNILGDANSERRYIPPFNRCDSQLPIVGVIVGPSRNREANVEFARLVVGSTIPVKCSVTPWLPPHLP
jgi:hypothetical protein